MELDTGDAIVDVDQRSAPVADDLLAGGLVVGQHDRARLTYHGLRGACLGIEEQLRALGITLVE